MRRVTFNEAIPMNANGKARRLLFGWSLVSPLAIMVALCGALVAAEPTKTKAPKTKRAKVAAARQAAAVSPQFDPTLTLIRDEGVRRELGIGEEKAASLDELIGQVDLPLFRLRDQSPDQAGPERLELTRKFNQALKELLTAPERKRLAQLVVQAQGWSALVLPGNANALELSEEQRQRTTEILSEKRAALAKLEKDAGAKPTPYQLGKAQELKKQEGEEIVAILDDRQKKLLQELVGESYDLSRVRQVVARAPELVGIESYLNSGQFSLADLKGRVIALHFFAFG